MKTFSVLEGRLRYSKDTQKYHTDFIQLEIPLDWSGSEEITMKQINHIRSRVLTLLEEEPMTRESQATLVIRYAQRYHAASTIQDLNQVAPMETIIRAARYWKKLKPELRGIKEKAKEQEKHRVFWGFLARLIDHYAKKKSTS